MSCLLEGLYPKCEYQSLNVKVDQSSFTSTGLAQAYCFVLFLFISDAVFAHLDPIQKQMLHTKSLPDNDYSRNILNPYDSCSLNVFSVPVPTTQRNSTPIPAGVTGSLIRRQSLCSVLKDVFGAAPGLTQMLLSDRPSKCGSVDSECSSCP